MILLAALDKYVLNEWVNLFKSSNKNFLLSQDHHLPLDLASLLTPLHQILHPDARCPERHCMVLVQAPPHVIFPHGKHLQRCQEQLKARLPETIPAWSQAHARRISPPVAWLVPVIEGWVGTTSELMLLRSLISHCCVIGTRWVKWSSIF